MSHPSVPFLTLLFAILSASACVSALTFKSGHGGCDFAESPCAVISAQVSLISHFGVEIEWFVPDACKDKDLASGMFRAHIREADQEPNSQASTPTSCETDDVIPSSVYSCTSLEPNKHYEAVIVGPKCSNATVHFRTAVALATLHSGTQDGSQDKLRRPLNHFMNMTTIKLASGVEFQVPYRVHKVLAPHFFDSTLLSTGCQRPTGWCTQTGASFKSVDCDGDGLLDIWCETSTGTKMLDLSSTGCVSVVNPTYADCPAALSGCARPSGWCTAVGSTFKNIDCDGDGRLDNWCEDAAGNKSYMKTSAGCTSVLTGVTYDDCPTARSGCARPAGWCEAPGQIYRNVDCDGDGKLDHWCDDGSGSKGIIRSGNSCAAKFPGATYTDCPAAKPSVQVDACDRPSSWCGQTGAVYKNIDCDYDGLLDHWCEDGTGAKGFIKSSDGCVSRWPSQSYIDCPPAATGTCKISTVTLTCGSRRLSFNCSAGSTVSVEVRRAMNMFGSYQYPESRRVIYTNVVSPFVVPVTVQAADRFVIRGHTTAGFQYKAEAVCPPEFLAAAPPPALPDVGASTLDYAFDIPPLQRICTQVPESGTLTLTCPPYTYMIGPYSDTSFVNFGQTSGSCQTGFKAASTCKNTDSVALTGALVDAFTGGRSVGTITASTAVLGDPCVGKPKTLTVSKLCAFTPANGALEFFDVVTSSPVYSDVNGFPYGTGYAFNGDTSGDFYWNAGTTLKKQLQPWMKLNYTITRRAIQVRYYPRTDCCRNQSNNANIILSRRGVGTVWTGYVPYITSVYVFNIPTGIDFDAWMVKKLDTDFLSIAEVEVHTVGAPMPVAIGGIPSASSLFPVGGAIGPLSKLNDGIVDGIAVATTSTFRPSFTIDLQSTYSVVTVVFYPRSDCCFDQSSDLDITMYLNGVVVKSYYVGTLTSPNPIIFQEDSWGNGPSADKIIIKKRGTGILSVVELMVYAFV